MKTVLKETGLYSKAKTKMCFVNQYICVYIEKGYYILFLQSHILIVFFSQPDEVIDTTSNPRKFFQVTFSCDVFGTIPRDQNQTYISGNQSQAITD